MCHYNVSKSQFIGTTETTSDAQPKLTSRLNFPLRNGVKMKKEKVSKTLLLHPEWCLYVT